MTRFRVDRDKLRDQATYEAIFHQFRSEGLTPADAIEQLAVVIECSLVGIIEGAECHDPYCDQHTEFGGAMPHTAAAGPGIQPPVPWHDDDDILTPSKSRGTVES